MSSITSMSGVHLLGTEGVISNNYYLVYFNYKELCAYKSILEDYIFAVKIFMKTF